MSKGRLKPKAEVYTPNSLDKTRFNNDKLIAKRDLVYLFSVFESGSDTCGIVESGNEVEDLCLGTSCECLFKLISIDTVVCKGNTYSITTA